MSDQPALTKEPYLGYRRMNQGIIRNFLDDYRANLVEFKVDAGTDNLLVTGRPNSGIEEFQELLIARLEETGRAYETIDITDMQSIFKAKKAFRETDKLIIVNDPHRLLFSIGNAVKPHGIVYFTRHWNLLLDGKEYRTFDHHIAFASHRNQEIGEYPGPFAGIGSDLQKGEYISIDTGQFSMVTKTAIK